MGNLYHALRIHADSAGTTPIGGLFAVLALRAYLQRMRFSGPQPRSIRRRLAGSRGMACAREGHARSYGKIDAFVVREKIQKDLPKINRCYESALRYEPRARRQGDGPLRRRPQR